MYISKDFIKRLFVVAIGVAAYFALVATLAKAEINGAVGCGAGHLTILTSDKPAVWTVYPAEYSTSYAISEDGRTVYFASPKAGKVTFFAASVVEGQPFLEQHSLYNGVEIPDPMPTPAPTPIPEPIVDTLESVIVAKAKGKPAEELTALADSFDFVVDGIDRGTITTPVAARETFRAIYIEKGAAANENTVEDLSALVDAISEKVDNSTLKSIRADYETAAKTIRSVISVQQVAEIPVEEEQPEAQSEETEEKAEPKKEEVKSCPNGQCPNTANQGRFFWRY